MAASGVRPTEESSIKSTVSNRCDFRMNAVRRGHTASEGRGCERLACMQTVDRRGDRIKWPCSNALWPRALVERCGMALQGEMRLIVWDVEHGACSMLQHVNGQTGGRLAMIDSGSKDDWRPSTHITQTLGRQRLDYLFITNADQDT